MFRIIAGFIVIGLVYFQGVKPLMADHYATRGQFQKALEWTPDDSILHMKTGNIIRAIETNNGDLTQYAIWCDLGIRLAKQGAKDGAIKAFEKSLWYYPAFEPAKSILEAVKK